MSNTHNTIAADDEAYWATIRAQYSVSSAFTNLEQGYFGVQAQPVFSAFLRYQQQVNTESSFFMRQHFAARLAEVKVALAAFCGVEPGELLVTRNLVECMNVLLQGYPWAAGDAVVCATHDYDSVVETLEMVQQRKGIVLQRVAVPLDPVDDAQIVDCYARAITPQTRLVLLTHMVHLTGQIMPVAKIAAMARSRGVDVAVDAAHSFAHIDFQFPQLNSDFVAVNLHKWLGAPLGVGLLYIRKNRIADIAPLYGDVHAAPDTIDKLAHMGTLPPAPILAVIDALRFHQSIGSCNKEARLRHLSQYWLDQVCDLPRFELLTPRAPQRRCAIAAFRIQGMAAPDVVAWLLAQRSIFTVERTINGEPGVRVTPGLFTSKRELDALVEGIRHLCTQA